jgi:LytR cell envelope-related transcriptional attenuator
MSPVNLGAGRIIVIVALVVGGVALLINGFSGTSVPVSSNGPSGSSTPSSSTTPSGTPEPTATPSPQVDGVMIAVFNGTTTTGLGAQGQQMLTNAGYVAPNDAMNAPTTGIAVTTVYYRGGAAAAQNKSNAGYMVKKHFKGGKVARLGSEFATLVPKEVQLAVVLGQDYANKAG